MGNGKGNRGGHEKRGGKVSEGQKYKRMKCL